MRGLGSRRGTVGADHDRFFAELLAARRAAEGFAEPESRLAAFDSQRLSQALTTLLGELAAERYPESGPDRRALEAELLEHAERVYAALDDVRRGGRTGAREHIRVPSRAVAALDVECAAPVRGSGPVLVRGHAGPVGSAGSRATTTLLASRDGYGDAASGSGRSTAAALRAAART